MKFLRDERAAAIYMLLAACFGFALENAKFFDASYSDFRTYAWPVISQVGMAMFFALIGFELKNEFSAGLFRKPMAIIVPTTAAFVGVLIPACVYAIVGKVLGADQLTLSGWSMVTATDVSFALMAYSLLAKGLPKQLRIFLLSFAVIDDILASIALAIGFWRADALTPLVSTTIAMLVAFSLGADQVRAVIKWLSPVVAFVVLPVFAFFAMQISFSWSALTGGAGSLLLVLFLTRPIAKWVGVFTGATIGNRLVGRDARLPISTFDFLRVSSLAGIGFVVSLLAADLTFGKESGTYAVAATSTVLASLVSAALAAIALRVRRGAR